MKRLVLGLLAHVDAGKTTLTEALLYRAGATRRLGRVDHGDAFLDTAALEKARGITIFSKQAVLRLPGGKTELTLLDTPGHVDFSAEMERALSVLDYAVLVVSGTDGVQAHTETLWRLLARYRIPVFIFINKMDLPGMGRAALMTELKARLSENCVDFSPEGESGRAEALALCSEVLLEAALAGRPAPQGAVAKAVAARQLFPVYWGSALKNEGIDSLLAALETDTLAPEASAAFAARVFKVSADETGKRLTWLKVTGGSLPVKATLHSRPGAAGPWEEKADQLRLYSGAKYTLVNEALPGMTVAVTGLTRALPGEGLGEAENAAHPALEPVLSCRVLPAAGTDSAAVLEKLRILEAEDPALHVVWESSLGEIHLRYMGEVQLEILQSELARRFGLAVTFAPGSILYLETVTAPVEGIGHYEPLRHYAEVHLLLEPAPRGSGLQFGTDCREEILDKNWQRLILTHLQEKAHRGVLTGAPLTDMKITLLAGRAHEKHTEGGDFRQATYRAVRQGLETARAQNAVRLLEPWYEYRIAAPADAIGRAMADIQRRGGSFAAPETAGEGAVLTGAAPVAALAGYAQELAAYTHGLGRLVCTYKGYEPCHNEAEVIAAAGYESARDIENPADSVFCSHGAGYLVKWPEVAAHAHVDSGWRRFAPAAPDAPEPVQPRGVAAYCGTLAEDKELMAIFERTYGPIKRDARRAFAPAEKPAPAPQAPAGAPPAGPEYLLVDGYNVIYAWEELHGLAQENLDAARRRLADILCNYRGYRKCEVILVFDAYRVPGAVRETEAYHNIHIVYTKEAETADAYIERVTHELSREHRVRVVTSDGAEQAIILGNGALRVSAAMFQKETAEVENAIRDCLTR